MKEKDFIIKKIFLNFTVKDKNILSYQLNQPFDRFIKEGKFRSSRDGAIKLELLKPVYDSLISYWDYSSFDQNVLQLSLQNQAQMKYNQIKYEY